MTQYFYTDPKTGTKTEVSLAEAQRLFDAGEKLTSKEVADTSAAPVKDIDYSTSTPESRENKLGALQQRGPRTRAEELSKVIDNPESAEAFATVQPYSAAYYAANPQELDKPWYRTSAGQIKAGAQDALSLPGRLLSAGVNTGIEGAKGLFSDRGYVPDESFASSLGRIHEDRGTNFAGSVARDPLTTALMLTGAGATAAGAPALLSGLYGTVGRYAPAVAGALGLGAASAAEGALVGGEDEPIIADAVAGALGSLGGRALNAATRSQIAQGLAARFRVSLETASAWLKKYGGYTPSETAGKAKEVFAKSEKIFGNEPLVTKSTVQPITPQISKRMQTLYPHPGNATTQGLISSLREEAMKYRKGTGLTTVQEDALDMLETELGKSGKPATYADLRRLLTNVQDILPGTDKILHEYLRRGASAATSVPLMKQTVESEAELLRNKGSLEQLVDAVAREMDARPQLPTRIPSPVEKLATRRAALDARARRDAMYGAVHELRALPPELMAPGATLPPVGAPEGVWPGIKHWASESVTPILNKASGGLDNTIAPWAYPGIPLASDRYQAGMGRRGRLADMYGMD